MVFHLIYYGKVKLISTALSNFWLPSCHVNKIITESNLRMSPCDKIQILLIVLHHKLCQKNSQNNIIHNSYATLNVGINIKRPRIHTRPTHGQEFLRGLLAYGKVKLISTALSNFWLWKSSMWARVTTPIKANRWSDDITNFYNGIFNSTITQHFIPMSQIILQYIPYRILDYEPGLTSYKVVQAICTSVMASTQINEIAINVKLYPSTWSHLYNSSSNSKWN